LNWKEYDGLSFYIRADASIYPLSLVLHTGSQDNKQTYSHRIQSPPTGNNDWSLLQIPWSEFRRVEWEDNPGTPVDPGNILGLAFILEGSETGARSGEIFIDDIQLISRSAGQPAQPQQQAPAAPQQAQPAEPVSQPSPVFAAGAEPTPQKKGGRIPFCPLSVAAGLTLALGAVWFKKKADNRAGR